MAVMGAVDIQSTEDTLTESPGENRAGDKVARHVACCASERRPAAGRGRARELRQRDRESEQQEEEPPSSVPERVEPQRGEQRDGASLERAPQRHLPPFVGSLGGAELREARAE